MNVVRVFVIFIFIGDNVNGFVIIIFDGVISFIIVNIGSIIILCGIVLIGIGVDGNIIG